MRMDLLKSISTRKALETKEFREVISLLQRSLSNFILEVDYNHAYQFIKLH